MKTSDLGKFTEEYINSGTLRLHMPGHKGAFGYENDLTEIKGADSLYAADGVIKSAEDEISRLFGSRRSCLGTEGSSQIIKAMCFLAIQNYRQNGGKAQHPVILATRNAHKAFISAALLLGFDIAWMSSGDRPFSLCRCELTPDDLESYIQKYDRDEKPAAVFVTSPDYLGNMLDIKGLAETAHKHGLLFLCDNAHGSYLRFMKEDRHPLSLGADMTSDSAHKTLPVLTGGAFLHISKNAPEGIEKDVKHALLTFGSTSPSYLILESLAEAPVRIDRNSYTDTADALKDLRSELISIGYRLYGDEELKLVIDLRNSALTGPEFADGLRKYKIECEYADPDFVVTMWSPYNIQPENRKRFTEAMRALFPAYKTADTGVHREFMFTLPMPRFMPCEIMYEVHRPMSVNDPLLKGRIAADTLIICPPAVSPIVMGEVIDENAIEILRYYGFETVEVLA